MYYNPYNPFRVLLCCGFVHAGARTPLYAALSPDVKGNTFYHNVLGIIGSSVYYGSVRLTNTSPPPPAACLLPPPPPRCPHAPLCSPVTRRQGQHLLPQRPGHHRQLISQL
jgi:hypothetical protein